MSRFTLKLVRAALVLAFASTVPSAALAAAAPPGPSPASARTSATPLRLPAPIAYADPRGPDAVVTFHHDTHVALAGNRCLGCHPEPFRMLKPTRRILHADMESGRSCGRCHDGKGAFAVTDASACQTCHAGSAKASLTGAAGAKAGAAAVPATRGPGAIAFKRGEASPGAVRFQHETHLRGNTACATCHPKPYAMRATGGTRDGAMHEAASCGGCHDGHRAFGVENADACARCHREQESKP